MGSSKFKRLVERRNISVPWFSTQIILINGPTLLSLTWSHSYFISGIPVTSYITPSIYLDTLYLDTIYLDNIYLRRHAVSLCHLGMSEQSSTLRGLISVWMARAQCSMYTVWHSPHCCSATSRALTQQQQLVIELQTNLREDYAKFYNHGEGPYYGPY